MSHQVIGWIAQITVVLLVGIFVLAAARSDWLVAVVVIVLAMILNELARRERRRHE